MTAPPDASATEMLLQAHQKRRTAARFRERSRTLTAAPRAVIEARASELDAQALELEQQAERLMRR
jgi:hypothetical protein